MGYCSSCGKRVDDKIVGYDTRTGEPIYSTFPCKECMESLLNSIGAYERVHKRERYEHELKKINDKEIADLISTRHAIFERQKLYERYKKFL